MKWYEAKNVEDLKKIGNLKTVKMQINKDIKKITGKNNLDSFIKMGSSSWKGQYEKIVSLKKIIDVFYNDKVDIGVQADINNSKKQDNLDCNYFKYDIISAITEMRGLYGNFRRNTYRFGLGRHTV